MMYVSSVRIGPREFDSYLELLGETKLNNIRNQKWKDW